MSKNEKWLLVYWTRCKLLTYLLTAMLFDGCKKRGVEQIIIMQTSGQVRCLMMFVTDRLYMRPVVSLAG